MPEDIFLRNCRMFQSKLLLAIGLLYLADAALPILEKFILGTGQLRHDNAMFTCRNLD